MIQKPNLLKFCFIFCACLDDGGSGDMVTQEDTIFVSGMDPETTEDEIANHFGAIGIIKVKYRKEKIRKERY